MKRKIMAAFLAAILSMTAMPFFTVQTYAYSEGSTFEGKDCTDNENAAAAIDYLMNRYPHGKTFDSPGTCWGYAVKINDLLADSSRSSYYNGLRFTKTNFKNKCLRARAGTHIRFSHGSTFNGGYGHSVVLLEVDDNKVLWADNNYYAYNTVCYYQGTLNDFYKCYGQYGYINMVSKPVKYKIYDSPRTAAKALKAAGRIRLNWMKASAAERYQIYRSYAKDGEYKLIGEVENDIFQFTDDTVKKGKKAWYKIKAVKESGNKWSGAVSCRAN
ncbi:hypothetical protein ACDL92_06225 [Ihubacter sp. mB4P-1]|uniref:hypothetical protein n=1 Tax=Ihubacter sp. mB4P-1 TaxID=3242370 RepID=UPI00137A31F6